MDQREPITQTQNVSDVQNRLTNLVDAVYRKEARVLIEQNGVPVAALVSAEDLERLAELAREQAERRRLLARLREPFRHIPPHQIEEDVAAVIAEVRAELADEQAPVSANR